MDDTSISDLTSRPGMKRIVGTLALGAMLAIAQPCPAGLLVDTRPSWSDCYIEENVVGASGAKTIPCLDGGDPCDTDGVQNGVCVFKVALCPNQTNVPDCTAAPPLTRVRVKSIPKGASLIPPPDPASTVCGPAVDVAVPMKVRKNGKRMPGKLKFIVTARSSGRPRKDRDEIVLQCEPCEPCGVRCGRNPDGGPDGLDLSSLGAGSDLDIGSGGGSHDFVPAPRSMARLCLAGCNADSNPICDVNGPVGSGSLNGPSFGPPLPLVADGVPVCVVNRHQGPIHGTVNVQTGEIPREAPLEMDLLADVHLTLSDQVCPRCTGRGTPQYGGSGTCDGGAHRGQPCTIDSVLTVSAAAGDPLYPLSKDCPPDSGQLAGTVPLKLTLTTGTSTLAGRCPGEPETDACHGGGCGARCTGSACASITPDGACVDAKGGLSQVCCNDATDTPCFPDPIVRSGTAAPPAPAWPDPSYPKTTDAGVLVATFCVGATNTVGVDAAAGLPGPGAIILPVRELLLRVP